jgi:eukaryotic-like serine/threonine-protein kinase
MNGADSRDVILFAEALQLEPEERAAFLTRACAGNEALRQKVEALLKAQGQVGDFLEQPATGMAPQERAAQVAGEKRGDCIGHYKLLQQIGEGGCGVVYLAGQQQPIRRRVALKIIKPGMDTKSVIARFEAERQALALMDHPNIAKVFDAGATESGRPYFVMELVRGVKITEYCDEHLLTTVERLELFVQVCQAVQHAHQKGIIHRDIKPSNILVTTTLEGAPVPVVIDFGIAKATSNRRLTNKTLFTAFEMFIGTPAYMSPEQAALTSVDVDTRTDIYSLGVLLYELLTGSTPFDTGELMKEGLDEIRRVIREEEPVRPSTRLSKMTEANLTTIAQHRKSEAPTLIRGICGDLDWIAMKAMEKNRAHRYETVNGLAIDVQRFLADETVSAHPPSNFYKVQKAVLRNKLLFAGISVIALLVVVGLIVVSASLAKERQARREAEAASAKSQQVTTFLKDMLNCVDPAIALGRDTTILREILDRTAERVGRQMTNQPAVEAELRSLIGTVYRRIGNNDRAEEMYRGALAINLKQFGPQSPEVAASLNDLGLALLAGGRLQEAESVDEEALAIRRRLPGNNDADVATSLNNLGHVYTEDRRRKEAEALIREALAIRQKLFGSDNLDVADSLRNLSIILGDKGKWAESEAMLRDVFATRRKLLEPEDPSVASALADLAWATGSSGKLDEAESLARQALAMRRKLLAPDNPAVAASLYVAGDCIRQRGNLKEAYDLLSEALLKQRKLLGADNLNTLYTLCSLGLTLEAQSKLAESEQMYREAVAGWCKRRANEDPDALYVMDCLSTTLEAEGKLAESEEVRRKTLAAWRKQAGNEDPHALAELAGLDGVLMAQKKFGEVEQLLGDVLTPTFVRQPSSTNLLFQRIDLMGRQGRWQEAVVDATSVLEQRPADHYRYHTLAGLLAITHNRPAYENLCPKIIATFSNTTDAYVAERMTSDCLLLPNSGVDLLSVDKLATRAISLSGGIDGLMAWIQTCKALSSYRQGRFSEAIEWSEKLSKESHVFAQAKAYAVLAMANWQLGRKDAARAAFAKGDALAPGILPGDKAVDLGDAWLAWLFARISLDEAAAVIHNDASARSAIKLVGAAGY